MYGYLKQTIKHSSVYSLGVVLQKGVGFFMIPFYTHYLTPGEYGLIEIVDLFMIIISMLAGMGISSALSRFYIKYEDSGDRREVCSTALCSVLLVSMLFYAILMLNVDFISRALLGTDEFGKLFHLVLLAFIVEVVLSVPQSILQAQKKSGQLVSISLATFVTYLSLNIALIGFMGWGVHGFFISALLGRIFNLLLLLFSTRSCFSTSFSRAKLKEMVRYGLPLLPATFAMLAIHNADRFILREYCGLEQLGMYSLGYKFGMIVSVIVIGPIFRIWNIQWFDIAKTKDAAAICGKYFTYIFLVMVYAGLCISLPIQEIIAIMAPESYQGAAAFVFIIVAAYVLKGCCDFFDLGFLVSFQTKYSAYTKMLVAAFNIGLSFMLVPWLGIFGAAMATVLSFLLLAIFSYRMSQKVAAIRYEWGRVLRVLIVAIVVHLLSLGMDTSVPASLAMKAALLMAFFPLLLLSGFFRPEEISKVKAILAGQVVAIRRNALQYGRLKS